MMKIENHNRRLEKSYIMAVFNWAKRLEAEEITFNANGTVTLMCRYGCICENYRPTKEELRKVRR